MPTASKQIYPLMAKVMAQVGPVGKDHKNPSQGYAYRAIDDVVAALQPAFIEHGVFVVPQVLEANAEQVLVGQKKTPMFHVLLRVKYTFYAPDGSSVEAITEGEATDTGDKAANKAMAAAHKYALVQTFSIPTSDPKDTEAASPSLHDPQQGYVGGNDKPPMTGGNPTEDPF